MMIILLRKIWNLFEIFTIVLKFLIIKLIETILILNINMFLFTNCLK